ncbi:dynein axonemal heavy chain 11-like [Chamaea fasciata]|uniref:dynein axonemal heavy chain 11-like n=1 Tax=Chamaea fasciata TaxID=190680 RepID=UPI00336A4BF5
MGEGSDQSAVKKGELMFSAQMEVLQYTLFCDDVPDTWTKPAYPSTHSFFLWVTDFLTRCQELDTWTQGLVLPAVVRLSGLFYLQCFLTAVRQSRNNWLLDKVCSTADVAKKDQRGV